MPTDPSIIGGLKSFQVDEQDPIGDQEKALSLKSMQQQQAQRDEDLKSRASLKQFAQTQDLTSPEGQRAYVSQAYKTGGPELGMQMQKGFGQLAAQQTAADKNLAEIQKNQQEAQKIKTDNLRSAINKATVDAQNAYESAKASGATDEAAGMAAQAVHINALQDEAKNGLVTPDQLQKGMASVSQTRFDPVKNALMRKQTESKEDLAISKEDAREKEQVKRDEMASRRESLAERRAAASESRSNAMFGLAERRLADSEKKAADTAASNVEFNDQDKQYWTDVLRKGGDLPPGLARSNSGRKLVAEVMQGVARSGTKPEEMMTARAEYGGAKAGERTLGTREATAGMASTEAASLAKLAVNASDNVQRSGIKSLNQAYQFAQKQGANPELRQFVAANTSLINAYARAINPQGVGTVADKEHAREMLETSFSKGDYKATVDQLLMEIDAAKRAPGQVKQEMRGGGSGGAAGGGGKAPQAAIDHLKANPQLKEAFKAKYGYLP